MISLDEDPFANKNLIYMVQDFQLTLNCLLVLSGELITQSACRGKTIELRCSSKKRIALHSAFYGYSPRFNVTDCALEPAFDAGQSNEMPRFIRCNYDGFEFDFLVYYLGILCGCLNIIYLPFVVCHAECSSTCSEQTVARLCLGRHHCRLRADGSVFGRPCLPETKEYLVVVFACGESPQLHQHSIRSLCVVLYSSLWSFRCSFCRIDVNTFMIGFLCVNLEL